MNCSHSCPRLFAKICILAFSSALHPDPSSKRWPIFPLSQPKWWSPSTPLLPESASQGGGPGRGLAPPKSPDQLKDDPSSPLCPQMNFVSLVSSFQNISMNLFCSDQWLTSRAGLSFVPETKCFNNFSFTLLCHFLLSELQLLFTIQMPC